MKQPEKTENEAGGIHSPSSRHEQHSAQYQPEQNIIPGTAIAQVKGSKKKLSTEERLVRDSSALSALLSLVLTLLFVMGGAIWYAQNEFTFAKAGIGDWFVALIMVLAAASAFSVAHRFKKWLQKRRKDYIFESAR